MTCGHKMTFKKAENIAKKEYPNYSYERIEKIAGKIIHGARKVKP